jgi:hypothetical protein
MTGLYVQVAGAVWPLRDFLASRALAVALPTTRARALGELWVVVAVLAALERADVQEPARCA